MAESIYELTDPVLANILPSSIADDEQLNAAADGLDGEFQQIATDISTYLPLIPNLAYLPERIIDLLAWQFHVDNYDSAGSLAYKRGRVMSAIDEHRRHGTVSMAKATLDEVFSASNYTLIEWWENTPKHDPYTFRVFINIPFDQDDIDQALLLLGTVGNVRSHWVGNISWDELDAIGYTWNELDSYGLTWNQLDMFLLYIAPGILPV